MHDSLIFDLDGTLWSASAASANGWTQALHELGYDNTISATDIGSVTGMPFEDCVRTLCPMVPESDFEQFMNVLEQREAEAVKAIGGSLYEGVANGLPSLMKAYKLFIVSNCQEWYLDIFFDQFKLRKTFIDWECHGRTGKPKWENLRDIVLRNSLNSPIYIGDTESDRIAAEKAKTEFIHVTYGFGKTDAERSFNSFGEFVSAVI